MVLVVFWEGRFGGGMTAEAQKAPAEIQQQTQEGAAADAGQCYQG